MRKHSVKLLWNISLFTLAHSAESKLQKCTGILVKNYSIKNICLKQNGYEKSRLTLCFCSVQFELKYKIYFLKIYFCLIARSTWVESCARQLMALKTFLGFIQLIQSLRKLKKHLINCRQNQWGEQSLTGLGWCAQESVQPDVQSQWAAL